LIALNVPKRLSHKSYAHPSSQANVSQDEGLCKVLPFNSQTGEDYLMIMWRINIAVACSSH